MKLFAFRVLMDRKAHACERSFELLNVMEWTDFYF